MFNKQVHKPWYQNGRVCLVCQYKICTIAEQKSFGFLRTHVQKRRDHAGGSFSLGLKADEGLLGSPLFTTGRKVSLETRIETPPLR